MRVMMCGGCVRCAGWLRPDGVRATGLEGCLLAGAGDVRHPRGEDLAVHLGSSGPLSRKRFEFSGSAL
jgi:hypothetical protein